jgi:hypothetical protein
MGFFFTLFLWGFFFLLSELLRPKPKQEQARPAGLGDFNFPTASETRHIPLVWGTVKIDGPNVVWYGDLQKIPITKKVKTGLFSSKTVVVGYYYFLGVQFALCRGVAEELRRIWVDERILYDGTVSGSLEHNETVSINRPLFFGGTENGTGGLVGPLRYLSGTTPQAAPTYLAGKQNPTTGYPGTAYVLLERMLLGTSSNLPPWAFELQKIPEDLSFADPDGTVDLNFDVNPPSTEDTYTAPENFTTRGTVTIRTYDNGAFVDGDIITVTVNGTVVRDYYTLPSPASPDILDITQYLLPYQQNEITVYAHNEGGVGPRNTTQFDLLDEDGSEITGRFNLLPLDTGYLYFNWYPEVPSSTIDYGDGVLDANPIYVLWEIMTNSDWGLGLPTSDIDRSSFLVAAATCTEELNGFSLILDSQREAYDLIEEIQRQVDGVVFISPRTGKWKIKLIRNDYVVDDLVELNESNILEIKDYTKGTIEDTTNEVRAGYSRRVDFYQESFIVAQDSANIRAQGEVVSTTIQFPGVKNSHLASKLAWRELRLLSYPLAKATLRLNRSMYLLEPGQAVRWSDPLLGFTNLVMRVTRIDYGSPSDASIEVSLIQDIFGLDEASYDDPPDGEWENPTERQPEDVDLVDQVVFEAPYAMCRVEGVSIARVWFGARSSSQYMIGKTDADTAVGEVNASMLTLQLSAALNASDTSFTALASPDTAADVDARGTFVVSSTQNGEELLQLVLVDQEFMLVNSMVNSAGNFAFTGVTRGVLDSVPTTHSAYARVHLLFTGGNLTTKAYEGNEVLDFRICPVSAGEALDYASATSNSLTLQNRAVRPYPPVDPVVNSVSWPSSVNANTGLNVSFTRRDYLGTNEVTRATTSAFPGSTEYRCRVLTDGVERFTTAWNSGAASIDVYRSRVLRYTSGALPTNITWEIATKHTFGGSPIEALQKLTHTATYTDSELSNDTNMGVRTSGVATASWVVPDTGTYDFILESSASLAVVVEAQVNGGGWSTVITSGATTGTLALTAGDSLAMRFTGTAARSELLVRALAPVSTADGYAVYSIS